MTRSTQDQEHQMQAAAAGAVTRFQTFDADLTRDEQQALDIALRHAGAGADQVAADTTGYLSALWLPLIAVKIVEQSRQRRPPSR